MWEDMLICRLMEMVLVSTLLLGMMRLPRMCKSLKRLKLCCLMGLRTRLKLCPPVAAVQTATSTIRQQRLQDGNLILNGSDFDDSRTISDLPAEPTPMKKPKLKSVIVKVGNSSAINMEAPQYPAQALCRGTVLYYQVTSSWIFFLLISL